MWLLPCGYFMHQNTWNNKLLMDPIICIQWDHVLPSDFPY